MRARPWMKFYPADYLGDTQHLTAEQHGVYLLLLMHYWMRGGLPASEIELARITKLGPARWKKHREIISRFFYGGWKHKRIERELNEGSRPVHGRKADRIAIMQKKRATKHGPNRGDSARPQNPESRRLLFVGKGIVDNSGDNSDRGD